MYMMCRLQKGTKIKQMCVGVSDGYHRIEEQSAQESKQIYCNIITELSELKNAVL
jgi:hypothetical protein